MRSNARRSPGANTTTALRTPWPGAGPHHSQIAGNTGGELRSALRGNGAKICRINLKQGSQPAYFYPDCLVVSDHPRFLSPEKDVIENPILIAEVVSPTTELFDSGPKFEKYKSIESLLAYLLISQTEPQVELHSRQPGGEWLPSNAARLTASVHIPAVESSLPLAGIYEYVEFTSPA